MLYTTFENKSIIKGVLTAVDPLHIGGGYQYGTDLINADGAVLKDAAGNPVIPGSALKGVVRTKFETILRAAGITVCDPFNDKDENCLTRAKAVRIKQEKLPPAQQAEKLYQASCDVCRLFGNRQFAGKLHFKDCCYLGDAPCRFEKRECTGVDRVTGSVAMKAKHTFEIIPKGTQFDFVLIVENLAQEQERYLALILDILCGKGITDEDFLTVGGKSTRGLGRIRLDITEQTRFTADDCRNKILAFLNREE